MKKIISFCKNLLKISNTIWSVIGLLALVLLFSATLMDKLIEKTLKEDKSFAMTGDNNSDFCMHFLTEYPLNHSVVVYDNVIYKIVPSIDENEYVVTDAEYKNILCTFKSVKFAEMD